jgi:hypothetical protein
MSLKNYYDRVYLCVEKKNQDDITIKGFDCYLFTNFEEADFYFNKKKDSIIRRSTMIPICKWTPQFFDPYIIDYKLKKLFWLNSYTFYKKRV